MSNSDNEVSLPELFDPFFLETLQEKWAAGHYLFGAEIIDAQHLWSLALLHKADILLRQKKEFAIAKATAFLGEAVSFIDEHLKFEEDVMRASEFPDIDRRLQEHRELVQNARQLLQQGKSAALMPILNAWFERHARETDVAWRTHLLHKHTNLQNFISAVQKDPVGEAQMPHALLYRQLMISHEILPGIKKAVIEDIFQIWKRFAVHINIPLIDMQHLWLIKMIVELEGMLHISFDERRAMLENVLSDLIAYVQIHFDCEEALMAKLQFPDFAQHHKIHVEFRRSVHKMHEDYLSGNHHALSGLVTMLRQWLVTHIVIEDTKIARFAMNNKIDALTASRVLIRDKQIPIDRDHMMLYTYVSARLRALG